MTDQTPESYESLDILTGKRNKLTHETYDKLFCYSE